MTSGTVTSEEGDILWQVAQLNQRKGTYNGKWDSYIRGRGHIMASGTVTSEEGDILWQVAQLQHIGGSRHNSHLGV